MVFPPISMSLFRRVLLLGFMAGVLSSCSNDNKAPTAQAGVDQTVNENTSVTIEGIGQDSDGTIKKYLWTQDSGLEVTIDDRNNPMITFLAPEVTEVEQLSFSLIVTDNSGKSASDTVLVTVNNVNQPPVADAGADTSVYSGTTVSLAGNFTDPDDNIASISWVQSSGPSIKLTGSDQGSPQFIAPATLTDVQLEFGATVTDSDGLTSTDTVVVSVTTENPAPLAEISGTRLGSRTQDFNNPVNHEILFIDGSESSGINFEWEVISSPENSLHNLTSPNTPSTGFYANSVGDYELQIKANNGQNQFAEDSITITLIEDVDGDGVSNANDPDRDGDSFANSIDKFPDDIVTHLDSNDDSTGNYYQEDVDGDGFADIVDDFALDATQNTLLTYQESKESAAGNSNDGISVSETAGSAPIKIDGLTYSLTGPDLDYYKIALNKGIYSAVVEVTNTDFIPTITVVSVAGDQLPITRTNFPATTKKTAIGFSVATNSEYYLVVTDSSGRSGDDWSYSTTIVADTDMDGLSDQLEQAIDSNHLSADSDGDSILDYVEVDFAMSDWSTNKDIDQDGIPAWWDMDSDGDLIPDRVEYFTLSDKPTYNTVQLIAINDVDGDGIPNFLDTSSDNTSFADDNLQVGSNPTSPLDTDNDGVPDFIDLDNDNDGLLDQNETIDTYNIALIAPGSEGTNLVDALLIGDVTNTERGVANLCLAGDILSVSVINGPTIAAELNGVFNTVDGAITLSPNSLTDGVALFTCPDNIEAGLVELYLTHGSKRSGSKPLQFKTLSMPILTAVNFDSATNEFVVEGLNLSSELSVNFNGASVSHDNSFGAETTVTLSMPVDARSGYVSVSNATGTSNELWVNLTRKVAGMVESPNPTVDVSTLDLSLAVNDEQMALADGSFETDAAIGEPTTVTALLPKVGSTEGAPLYSYYLSSIVFPEQSTTTLNAESTALSLVWNGLGINMIVEESAHLTLFEELSSLDEIIDLTTVLSSQLTTNPDAISSQNSALALSLENAMVAASELVANSGALLQQSNINQTSIAQRLFSEDATVTPAEADDISVYEYGDLGNIKIDNDTQLYLSAKITATDGTVLEKHITGLSGMAGPQGYGLLFWGTPTDYKHPSGKNALVEVIAPGIGTEYSPTQLESLDVWKKLYFRTTVERVLWPLLKEVIPLPESDFVDILWENAPGIVDIVVTKALNGDASGSVKDLVKLLWQDIASIPPGPITTALAKKIGKDAAEKILAKIAAKIGAKFVPGVGQIQAAAEIAGIINTGANVTKTIVDIGSTDAVIHYNVVFPLSIESVEPSKVFPDGSSKTFAIVGSGFTEIQRGFWPFDSYLKPKVKATDTDGRSVELTIDSINTGGTEMNVTISGSFLEGAVGSLSIEIHHPSDTPNALVNKADAIEIVNQLELSSISPSEGGAGIPATLYGTGFSIIPSENEILIGSEKALVYAANESSLSLIIPMELDPGSYMVTGRVSKDGTWGDSSNSIGYEVVEGDVSITVCDNGGLKDDAFALYLNGIYIDTMYASNSNYCDTYNPNLSIGSHTAFLLGVEAPDSVGTYSISFDGVTDLQGAALSGSDLTPGVRKSYSFEVLAPTAQRRPISFKTSEDSLKQSSRSSLSPIVE